MLLKSQKLLFFVLLLQTFYSCTTSSSIVYLQDADSSKSENKKVEYEPKLQPDDLLSIVVSAENPESTIPFNLPQIQGNYDMGANQYGIKSYLIDNDGKIDFPVLGKIQLGGLARREANEKMVRLIAEYVKNPGINLRILNFKFSVLGEVAHPGTFTIDSERITLLEALGKAGDLTIYGKRSDIMLIRENNGSKSYHKINITKTDFVNSPYYYLSQNDVIVVNPNKTKINASVVGPNTTVIMTSISLLITLLVVLLK
jgi:polysaccharide export outer membrane protein